MAKAFTSDEAKRLSDWHRGILESLSDKAAKGSRDEADIVRSHYVKLDRYGTFDRTFRDFVLTNKSPFSNDGLLPLIQSIHRYMLAKELAERCRRIISTHAKDINALINDLEPSFNNFSWAITFGNKKTLAEQAYKELADLKESAYAQECNEVLGAFAHLDSITPEESVAAFSENSDDYRRAIALLCHLNNGPRKPPKLVEDLKLRKQSLNERRGVVESAAAKSKLAVKAMANDIVESRLKTLLSELPVDQLHLWNPRINIAALKDAGYKSFADFVGVNRIKLAQIPGIGSASLKVIRGATKSLTTKVRERARFTLDANSLAPNERALAVELVKLNDLNELHSCAQKARKAIPKTFWGDFDTVTKSIDVRFWFFELERFDDTVTDSFQRVDSILNGEYGDTIDQIYENGKKIVAAGGDQVSANSAIKRFKESPESYIKLLKKTAQGVYSADARDINISALNAKLASEDKVAKKTSKQAKDEQRQPRKTESVSSTEKKTSSKRRARLVDLTTYRKFERAEECVHLNDLVVRTSIRTCGQANHNIEEVIAIICVFTPGRGVYEVAVDAFCCRRCRKYFILEEAFDRVAARGSLCCRVITKQAKMKEAMPKRFRDLSDESLFKQLGYSVGKKEDLTPSERRTVLDFAIENGLKTQKETIGFIQHLIRFNGRGPHMGDSVQKWNSDIKYLMSSRTVNVERIRIDRIFLTEHNW